MPVDKPGPGDLKKVGFGFTVLDSAAIELIGDITAVGTWAYLCSKPEGWRINEKDVMKKMNIGRDRYRRAMSLLRECGLVWHEYTRVDGRITNKTVCITWTLAHARYCKPDIQADSTVSLNNSRTVIQSDGISGGISKEVNISKERKSSKEVYGQNEDFDPTFDDFWVGWPRKTDKKDARKAWLKIKDKRAVFDLIQANLNAHANAGDWDDPTYIPYPTTYLNGERWNDEVNSRANKNGADRISGVRRTAELDW